MLAEFFEIPVTDLDTKAVSDPYAAVGIDVDILGRALPAGLLVSGLVYDSGTGLIEVVVPPGSQAHVRAHAPSVVLTRLG